MSDEQKASLKQISEFFEYEKLSEFRTQWVELDQESKEQLQVGIGNGTLTY